MTAMWKVRCRLRGEQLESGEGLDDNFRSMVADEIDRFRREIVERTGDARDAENLADQELLREVMNTVGKYGRLGGSIRCVVSVSMLTEGWDANTVTHVLGIRAFGTQLLCEQVIGRALRRQSYDVNDEGLFNVEYADVLGIPFDFTAKPVVAPPQPPRETVHVRAIRPERDPLEIRFPRVVYRISTGPVRRHAKDLIVLVILLARRLSQQVSCQAPLRTSLSEFHHNSRPRSASAIDSKPQSCCRYLESRLSNAGRVPSSMSTIF
jgi:hypothetical protein